MPYDHLHRYVAESMLDEGQLRTHLQRSHDIEPDPSATPRELAETHQLTHAAGGSSH